MRIDYIVGNWSWSILAGFSGGVERCRETLRTFTEAEAIQEFNIFTNRLPEFKLYVLTNLQDV